MLDAINVAVGAAVLLLSGYFALRWREEAAWIERWYGSMSKRDGRPWWRRGHFSPNYSQSVVVLIVFLTLFSAMGLSFILDGLGLIDLG